MAHESRCVGITLDGTHQFGLMSGTLTRVSRLVATVASTGMWLWIFYRFKQDGSTLLVSDASSC